jgi:PAS domain S-box-containing protein
MAQLYTFQLFNRDHGLSTQAIGAIAQDKLGYLYVGTDGAGLVRYDGYRFDPLEDKTFNAPMHVTQLCFINNETYFSTLYSGTVAYYNNEYHQIYSPQDGSGEHHGICPINNRLAVFIQQKIVLITTGGKEIFSFKHPNNKHFKYRQILSFPSGAIAFTDAGNYVVSENGVTPLHKYLNNPALKKGSFAVYKDGALIITSIEDRQEYKYSFERTGQIKLVETKEIPGTIDFGPSSIKRFSSNGKLFYFDDEKNIYKYANHELKLIAPNYLLDLGNLRSLNEDRDGNLWLSCSQGLVKISQEPFTRLEFHEFYLDDEIGSIFRSNDRTIFVSNFHGELFISDFYTPSKRFSDISVTGFAETNGVVYIASRNGLYAYKNKNLTRFDAHRSMLKPIQSLKIIGDELWYFCNNDALYCYDLTTKKNSRFPIVDKGVEPSHIYRIEPSHRTNELLLGSNEGIFRFNMVRKQAVFLESLKKLGSFAGNSIKDSYGTTWFSLDKGLVGFTKQDKVVQIDDIDVLKSVLTFTLSSDELGHLFVGSNLGINKLTMTPEGRVVNHMLYNKTNGFNGFETNMRSSFQKNNKIYVGTIDGLYEINAELLQNLPPPQAPVVFLGRLSQYGTVINDEKNRFLSFRSVTPRNKGIMYSYRILGVDTNWSDPSINPEIALPNLENGMYAVQVRATYDRIHFSPATNFPLHISSPFWQSRWFIVVIIILLGFGNILYIEWTSKGLNSRLGDFNHESIDARYFPKLLLFGLVINILVGLIDQYLLSLHFTQPLLNYVVSAVLFFNYITSRILFKRKGGGVYLKYVFYLSISLLAGQYYLMIYLSKVHPYPVIATLLLSTVIPYTVTRLRTIIIICVIQVSISILILIGVDKTVYNEYLYITAVVVSAALTILITYLRNDSLEKLIFVSNILNKGEIVVISFDQHGIINYASKNIADYFNVDTGLLIGKPLANLNPLVVTQEMRELSLVDEFEDGKTFLVPMYDKESSVVWIEFSCKQFSPSVKVIIGQDVTEKLTISTNYQSLVENAQDMIFNTDIFGNFIYLNEMSSRTFGYRNENLIGQNSINVIHPDYRQTVQTFYENQFANRIKHTYLEFPIRTKEGRIIWLGQNATMTFEPGSRKRISGFIALARDITEKRANELLIEQQNKDITASINSAKRIQFNLLPKQQVLQKYFLDYFVIYKPKDIVSGDFYWFHETNGKCFVVLTDCTGHGVAGAFMTIVGINLLNKLIIERQMDDPAEILNSLHAELNEMLHYEPNIEIPEGMQTLICMFESDRLTFSSSGVSIIHIKDESIEQFKTTRHELNRELYVNKTIPFSGDDSFYLITDGYQKQFGSIRNKKFSFRRIRELLEKIKVESMPLQKKYFENSWSNWSEGHEQTDDITIIGVKGFKNPSSQDSEPGNTTSVY